MPSQTVSEEKMAYPFAGPALLMRSVAALDPADSRILLTVTLDLE